MTITIRLKTGNAAFCDERDDDSPGNHEYARNQEIERILREWMQSRDRFEDSTLHDYNGNTVGTVTVRGK